MGITPNDIAAQWAMLKRGEEKRKADWKQAERERLRDTFAAAAFPCCHEEIYREGQLTGYPADWRNQIVRQAYAYADAMLAERSRTGQKMAESDSSRAVFPERESTNHDAAPAARASAESVAPQPTASDRSGNPTSHSGTGKQPAPLCVETDGFSPGSRTGPISRTPERESPRRECGESSLRDVARPDTKGKVAGGPEPSFSDRPKPVKDDDSDRSKPISDNRLAALEQLSAPQGSFRDSQNAKEPVAWAVETGGELEASFCGPAGREDAADWREQSGGVIVPLYRSPTITDEEREAVAFAYSRLTADSKYEAVAATLRSLLERMGGGR